jgi:hypothetical protein
MMFILTYPNGEAAWFNDMAELLESIEYDAYSLNDCGIYRIDPNHAWIDATGEVQAALSDHEEAMAWDGDHEAVISSPEKTGRI